MSTYEAGDSGNNLGKVRGDYMPSDHHERVLDENLSPDELAARREEARLRAEKGEMTPEDEETLAA